ncbi:MAG: stage II sporulation protein M [Oscillospiraceae bacterium]|nr:stage II sporulation protein M [Oscillospiraceae bacterium]
MKSKLARLFWFNCIFFCLITCLLYLYLARHPEFGQAIMSGFSQSKQDIVTSIRTQTTSSSYFWAHMRTTGLLFLNNIKVNLLFSVLGVLSFMAFPTIILTVNSFVMAAALAVSNMPFKVLFFCIMPHGIFELSSWFLAAAIGFYFSINLCEIYLKKPHDSVKYVFKNAGICFLLFVVPLTVIAAFVEAFLTPEIYKWFVK